VFFNEIWSPRNWLLPKGFKIMTTHTTSFQLALTKCFICWKIIYIIKKEHICVKRTRKDFIKEPFLSLFFLPTNYSDSIQHSPPKCLFSYELLAWNPLSAGSSVDRSSQTFSATFHLWIDSITTSLLPFLNHKAILRNSKTPWSPILSFSFS
jgi:hypothetical protein